MIALRSITFNLVFFTWTGALLTIGLPLLLMPAGAIYAVGYLWVRISLALLAGIVGLRYEFRGRPPAPGERVILAVKHQSAIDTMVFNLVIDRPAFVLKRELFFVPLFGWYLWRCRMIAIDRASGAKAILSMVRQAQQALARGQTLLIFPEGTRRAPDAPPQYQPGVAALYGRLGLPVMPVALNTGVFWGRRSFLKRPGRMVIEFLEPIPPGLDRTAFMAMLQERIETASQRLRAEALEAVDKSVDNTSAGAH
ncbi:MAG: 1-acyl-sn-glycerol-3-phosphate acyltransferase [Alphaproteobacteria bacterium]|nr:1-acyl-sn-glycerol-3-phosphate acyltransferase [Alphaproteobacteria bacterium]